MGDFASPALNQPSASDSEKQRIRELSRFYSAVRNNSVSSPSVETPQHTAQHGAGPPISSDITLNALAQLAVLRFGANRSFISLIDGQNQHIIAETTSSISLRHGDKHLPDDGVYLGVSTLDLAFGVCPDAVKLFTGQPVPALKNSANMTANSSRFIVCDFTLEDHFKDRPYVTHWPYFRFYAEVPVYSPAGYVLGSFCIVDDKPRSSFSDEDVTALQEISDSISHHLENIRIVHFHQRSDRLVHGLKEFIKRRPQFGLVSSTDSQGMSPSLMALSDVVHRKDSDQVETLGIGHISISTRVTEDPSPLHSDPNSRDLTDMTSVSYEPPVAALSRSSSGLDTEKKQSAEVTEDGSSFGEDLQCSNAPVVAVTETISVARQIAIIFSQASTLLRESMDLDGVLFLDASRCNSGIVHSQVTAGWEPLPRSTNPAFPVSPPAHVTGSSFNDRVCDTLGFASRSEIRTGQECTPCSVSESLLKTLVTAFPNGEVFNLKDWSTNANDAEKSLTKEVGECLVQQFPEADSIIFLPLWDFDKAQWLAGTFLWTRNRERALGLEELHYFRVFGDSLTSEVARVNWSKQEQSKSNFISSLSHELRSPLHGILASAELLSATSLQADQETFVKMLETCGRTLLDTMNHLLDFAKINNLTTAKSADNNAQKKSTSSLTSAFDLDSLVEEVVTTMYLGKLHSAPSKTEPTHGVSNRIPSKQTGEKVSVILRVTQELPWRILSITGAWRRIIMNLLGNALKYTPAGFVEISLASMTSLSDPDQLIAHLSVTDSGRGMSPEFLRHKLFSPFSQEDHLSEGVGLGLCIVQQLVKSLQGTIDVRSEPGGGTQVDIYIPVTPVAAQHSITSVSTAQDQLQPTQFCLVGFNAYSDLAEIPTGMLSREAKRKLGIQSFFAQLSTSQPGWSLSFADSLEIASGDIAIVEQSALSGEKTFETAAFTANTNLRGLLVMCDSVTPAATGLTTASGHVLHLPQPLCPRLALDLMKKIARAASLPDTPLVQIRTAATGDLRVPETCDQEISQPVTAPNADKDALRVLIVDDNAINVKVLSAFMKKLGWKYDTASNGLMAVDKYKQSPGQYKAVLMDISMPIMDGIDATKHIRTFEQRTSLPPVMVLAITGVASAAMKKQALAAGVDNYLIKPLSLQQLKISLRSFS